MSWTIRQEAQVIGSVSSPAGGAANLGSSSDLCRVAQSRPRGPVRILLASPQLRWPDTLAYGPRSSCLGMLWRHVSSWSQDESKWPRGERRRHIAFCYLVCSGWKLGDPSRISRWAPSPALPQWSRAFHHTTRGLPRHGLGGRGLDITLTSRPPLWLGRKSQSSSLPGPVTLLCPWLHVPHLSFLWNIESSVIHG